MTSIDPHAHPAPHRTTSLLLNAAHALDHMLLLVFATAVAKTSRSM
jgi:hypothetical protein